MKYIPFYLFLSLFIIACGGDSEEFVIPETLEEQKKLLSTKRTELQKVKEQVRELEKQTTQLQTEIDKKSPNVIKKTLVTTKGVERKDFERFTQVQGTIQTENTASAVSEIGGRIIRMNVSEGDLVRKGQLIAVTDLESVDKQMAELTTALDLANEVFQRQKRLWDQNIGSEIQYLQAKNNKERLEKTIETLQFQKTKANVYAPISGSIEMVIAKQGEVAGPGTPIVQILNTRKVKAVAEVPENLLKSVKTGERIKIEFPALGEEIVAPITRVGRTINPANRTFAVEADLNNSKGNLKPNLLAVIHLNDFSAKEVIVLDQNIIQQDVNGSKYVMTVGEGNKAHKTYIKTGESADGQVIVTEGLNDNAQIIEEGARTVSEGDVLEIKTK